MTRSKRASAIPLMTSATVQIAKNALSLSHKPLPAFSARCLSNSLSKDIGD